MDRAVVEELVKAARAAVREWRKQCHLARELGGDIAVNEGNAKAFTRITAAIAAAEAERGDSVDVEKQS